MGYDTTGDGKIDSIDYDGDGIIDARINNPPQSVQQPVQAYAVNASAPPAAYNQAPPAYTPPSYSQSSGGGMAGFSQPAQSGHRPVYHAQARSAMPGSVPQQGGYGRLQQPQYVQQPVYQAQPVQQSKYAQQPQYAQQLQYAQQPQYAQAAQTPQYMQAPTHQAPAPAQAPPPAQAQVLDFRTKDQKIKAANPTNTTNVGVDDGLLHAGKAAKRNGPSSTTKGADKATAVGATVVGVGAVGAGVGLAATNPDMVGGLASGVGSAIGGAANFIGGLFN